MTFERFGPEEGLPHNTVNDVLEDKAGFIWLATDGGLSRYDGYGFSSYRVSPTAGSNVLMGMLEDSRNRLWVASETGLWLFDRTAETFVAARISARRMLTGRYAQALLEDPQGRIWAGVGASILRTEPGGDEFREIHLPDAEYERIWSLASGRSGTIWAVVGDAGALSNEILEIDADRNRITRRGLLAERFQTALRADAQGALWTGPIDSTVELADSPLRTVSLPGTYLNDLAEEGDGTLWVGSAAGLYRLDPTSGRTERIPFAHQATSWQEEQIRALAVDRAGGLWVGTLGGLLRHDPHRKPFRHWTHDPRDPRSLTSDAVSDIVAGRHGDIWIGTFGGGINRVDPDSGHARGYRHQPGDPGSLPGDNVWTIATDSAGRLWTAPGVPAVLDPATGRFELRPLPLQDSRGEPAIGITALRRGRPGRIWAGSLSHGLFAYSTARGEWRHIPEVVVYSLSEPWEGGLWVGERGTVSRVDATSLQVRRFELATSEGGVLGDIEVLDLVPHEGGLWLGTTAGLGRFDLASEMVDLPIAPDELPGTVVFSVQPDADGGLWVGTNQGLARFDPQATADRVRVYDRADGIGNTEFNRHSRHLAPDGTIYLGGMNGLTIFHPREIQDNPYVPPLVLTGISALARNGEIQAAPFGLEQLVLPPLVSAVTFSFTALNYTRADRNRYLYRLEGFDEDWIDGGGERSARYTNLPPGEYVFHVRGSNNDGLWNEEGVRLPVVVKPAFWQTGWFRLMLGALTAAAIYVAYRLRLRRLIELERMRLRIAGDLHDELGSELSGIALASSRLASRGDLEAADRDRLRDVAASSLRIAQSLRDIVWYINPDHDNWLSTEARMRSVASSLCQEIDHDFQIELAQTRNGIEMDQRRNLYLIYKELLTNVARHSCASRTEIRLRADDRRVVLEVADNGIGFDPATTTDGTGLASIRRRAAKMNADLAIDSRPGSGSRVRVELNMT